MMEISWWSTKVFVLSFVIMVLAVCVCAVVMLIVVKGKIVNKNGRIFLSTSYQYVEIVLLGSIQASMLVLLTSLLLWIYREMHMCISLFTTKQNFIDYFVLTVALIFSIPIIRGMFKYIKKRQFLKGKLDNDIIIHVDEKGEMLQSGYLYFVNIVIEKINRLPLMGLIHLINLVLVISVNTFKALELESSLSSTSIYMAVATFYAVDKLISYLKKEYADVWIKLDNKIFLTEKINQQISITYEDIQIAVDMLFDHYIEEGKFEMTEEIKTMLENKLGGQKEN